jgi:hypothetical protein
MPSPDPDRHDGPEISGPGSALDWPRRAGATDEVLAELLRLSRRRRRFREGILVGAGAVLFAILLWPTGRELLVSAAAPTGTIAVDTPAQQRLSDGTVVDLQEGAAMGEAYIFYGDQRGPSLRHLQAAAAIGTPSSATRANVLVQIGELARLTDAQDVAAASYRAFIAEFPRDLRQQIVRDRLAEVEGTAP